MKTWLKERVHESWDISRGILIAMLVVIAINLCLIWFSVAWAGVLGLVGGIVTIIIYRLRNPYPKVSN